MVKYEAQHSTKAGGVYKHLSQEFDTKEEAIAWVDALGYGSVITWHVGPNLPGALPKLKYSSCALDVKNPGEAWKPINIF